MMRGDRAADRECLIPGSYAGGAIVVNDARPKQTPHVALMQRNHEIQTLSADRADQAFAERVRLRRPHRRLETVSPIAAIVRSTLSE
jgi:hypothetical protein